jgi:hypothetical protein
MFDYYLLGLPKPFYSPPLYQPSYHELVIACQISMQYLLTKSNNIDAVRFLRDVRRWRVAMQSGHREGRQWRAVVILFILQRHLFLFLINSSVPSYRSSRTMIGTRILWSTRAYVFSRFIRRIMSQKFFSVFAWSLRIIFLVNEEQVIFIERAFLS